MNIKKVSLAVLVIGIVMNVFDGFLHGYLLRGVYQSMTVMQQDAPVVWFVVLDFVFALVFVWVYEKVKGSFSSGLAGGALYGFYAGVLVSFPSQLAMKVMFQSIPYYLAWIWTISGIAWYVVAGLLVALIYRQKTTSAS